MIKFLTDHDQLRAETRGRAVVDVCVVDQELQDSGRSIAVPWGTQPAVDLGLPSIEPGPVLRFELSFQLGLGFELGIEFSFGFGDNDVDHESQSIGEISRC
jgi:hypothetical protein